MPVGRATRRCPRRTSRTARSVAAAAALLVVAACGSSEPTATHASSMDASSATSSSPSPDAAPGCRPADDLPEGGVGRRTIDVDGQARSYLLAVPADHDGRAPAPMVVALHGFGGSAEELAADTGLAEQGAARGSVVVLPDAAGSPARWNFDRRPGEADDYAYLEALVSSLLGELCVDADRVGVVGSSNGAAFAGLLACTEPYRFAAVAMVIATAPSVCPEGVAPATLTIRGTADPHVPFAGSRYGDATEIVEAYAARYGCREPGVGEHPATGVDRTRYVGCTDAGEVILDAVVDGVHRWPGGAAAVAAPEAAPGEAYDATDAVLDFFASHRRSR